jgi:hypothetical protein
MLLLTSIVFAVALRLEPRPGAGVAVNGNDLVAYHSLPAGAKDVLGRADHKRFLNVTNRLAHSGLAPAEIQKLHPSGTYEFWFASEENAQRFDSAPSKYLPAFGGHCSHGIASRGDLNATLLMDGRVAFTWLVGRYIYTLLHGTEHSPHDCSTTRVG